MTENTTNPKTVQTPSSGSPSATCSASFAEANIIIRNLLAINSWPLCENLHHSKKDRHEYDEDCPVMKRANAYIAHAEAFISSQNAKARHPSSPDEWTMDRYIAKAKEMEEALEWIIAPDRPIGSDAEMVYMTEKIARKILCDNAEAHTPRTTRHVLCGWRGMAGGQGCILPLGHTGGHGFKDGSGSLHNVRAMARRGEAPF